MKNRTPHIVFAAVLQIAVLSAIHNDAGLRAAESVADAPANDAKIAFQDVRGILEKHCSSCHGGREPAAEMVLSFKDEVAARGVVEGNPDFWDAVARMVKTKEMPPAKSKTKPTDAERELVRKWVDQFWDGGGVQNPGRHVVRRLNNREYANTIRDLFFLPPDWNAAADFPADERGDGFDNNSDTLTISPILIEQYLAAAEKTVNEAMNTDNKGNKDAQQRLSAPTKGYKDDFADWQDKVRLIIDVWLPRAYRRPVSKEEVDDVMKFAAMSFTHDGESVNKATALAMRAAIMSPDFLFRLEHNPNDDGTGKVFEISEFELANRLAYFLWSSMPDDELFAAAKDGKLRAELGTHVQRMLKSPKAISLTKDFMGQWLEIRGLDKSTNCTPELLTAMQGETEHFFDYIVKEDRSIMEFLDSDYTFVNKLLAEHYGMPAVDGDKFQKVPVDPQQRGGIFTQASFLTLTAKPLGNSRRTSPVNRGKWILENIFNEKIPPPPPDVPPLAVDDGHELKGTVRQIFEQHRADPACVTCHVRMDPYGFALENYDGFGVWRKQDNGVDVDASGEINGVKYTAPQEFRTILVSRKDDFRKALVTKMLSYSLSRGVEHYDKPVIQKICMAVEKDGDRFSSIITNLVESYPFQHARGSVVANPSENNR